MRALRADGALRWLRLSPAAAAAAVALFTGRLSDERLGEAVGPELEELEAAGIVSDGELVSWVARHLLLTLAPELHVEALITSEAGALTTEVWARGGHAVFGKTDSAGWVDLTPIEPVLVARALAAAVGLTASAGSAICARQPSDLARLARFEDALARGDHRRAGAVLGDGLGLTAAELALMAALTSPRRRAWRITATRTAAGGRTSRSLSVVDAGPFGLWCSERDSASALSPGHVVQLLPTSVADVWRRLLTILPPRHSDSCAHLPDVHVAPGRTPCPTLVPPIPLACSASSGRSPTSTPA